MSDKEWSFFYRQLVSGLYVDETCFYFSDDPNEREHYLGCLPQYEKPYWIGYCDVENGCEFESALELVNAPVFDGRSLEQRRGEMVVISVEGLSYDNWLRLRQRLH